MGKETGISASDSSKRTQREKLDQDDTAPEILHQKDIDAALSEIQVDSQEEDSGEVLSDDENLNGVGIQARVVAGKELEKEETTSDNGTDAISGETLSNDGNPNDTGVKAEVVLDKESEKDEATSDNETSEIDSQPQGDHQALTTAESDEKDFIGLDDDEIDDQTLEGTNPVHQEDQKEEHKNGESGNNFEKDSKTKNQIESGKKGKSGKTTAKNLKAQKTAKGPLLTKKRISLALLSLIIIGTLIYAKPFLVGVKKEPKPSARDTNETGKPAQPEKKKIGAPTPLGKLDKYIAKLEDAAKLRDKLLDKKEEIAKLKRHFHNRISELEDKIIEEMQKTGITSYSQALDNKFIELSLRTIQRRRSYMQELEKPALWVHLACEELLYLKRKAQVDLQLIDVAGGIDLDRHMRHISAAIQKYQPRAENLTVYPLEAELQPLETIWHQIINRQENSGQTSPRSANDEILKEICVGNFKRIAELTSITAGAAQCLSKLNGTDLFLNGLTKISPAEAKYLFHWRGNWICLNGIKKLSPEVAKYLFEWEGNWISLNGLTEFPPELALYLMKWNGQQLELMGLNYNSKNADQKALKYLALWETTGGKLFVSDIVRKEMERVLM